MFKSNTEQNAILSWHGENQSGLPYILLLIYTKTYKQKIKFACTINKAAAEKSLIPCIEKFRRQKKENGDVDIDCVAIELLHTALIALGCHDRDEIKKALPDSAGPFSINLCKLDIDELLKTIDKSSQFFLDAVKHQQRITEYLASEMPEEGDRNAITDSIDLAMLIMQIVVNNARVRKGVYYGHPNCFYYHEESNELGGIKISFNQLLCAKQDTMQTDYLAIEPLMAAETAKKNSLQENNAHSEATNIVVDSNTEQPLFAHGENKLGQSLLVMDEDCSKAFYLMFAKAKDSHDYEATQNDQLMSQYNEDIGMFQQRPDSDYIIDENFPRIRSVSHGTDEFTRIRNASNETDEFTRIRSMSHGGSELKRSRSSNNGTSKPKNARSRMFRRLSHDTSELAIAGSRVLRRLSHDTSELAIAGSRVLRRLSHDTSELAIAGAHQVLSFSKTAVRDIARLLRMMANELETNSENVSLANRKNVSLFSRVISQGIQFFRDIASQIWPISLYIQRPLATQQPCPAQANQAQSNSPPTLITGTYSIQAVTEKPCCALPIVTESRESSENLISADETASLDQQTIIELDIGEDEVDSPNAQLVIFSCGDDDETENLNQLLETGPCEDEKEGLNKQSTTSFYR